MSDGLSEEWHRRYDADVAAGRVKLSLKTMDMFYAADSEEKAALEGLGFVFNANGSPHTATKTGNPESPYALHDLHHLLSFVAKHGAVVITADRELVVMGGHAVHLRKLMELGQTGEGYTSVVHANG